MYEIQDKFYMRIPTYKLKKYFELDALCENDKIEYLRSDKIFEEALLISNRTIHKKFFDEKKSDDKLITTIEHYYTRMTTRATPLGLFAGISPQSLSSESLNRGDASFTKFVRPSMKWLMIILKRFETEELAKLTLYWNPALFLDRKRWKLNYVGHSGSLGNVRKNLSFLDTEFINFIYSSSKDDIDYQELVSLVTAKFGESLFSTEKLIKELVNKEILLTTLRPSLCNTDIFSSSLKKLLAISPEHYLVKSLQRISSMIKQYEKMKIGEGVQLLSEIYYTMSKVEKSTDYLQVDLLCVEMNNGVNPFEQLAHLGDLLAKIIPSRYVSSFEKYKVMFVEKYGYERVIPINELLDENIGLGIPDYDFNDSKNGAINSKLDKFLSRKIINSEKNNLSEVKIEETELLKLQDNAIPEDLISDKFEINVRFSENNKIEILPHTGVLNGGNSYGRFNYMTKEFENHNKDKVGTIEVELSEFPSDYRLINIMSNYNKSNYELCIANHCIDNKNTITLDDVFFGVRRYKGQNIPYFFSRKYQRELKFVMNNALNYELPGLISDLSRFMLHVSNLQSNPLLFIEKLNTFDNFNHIPRFELEGIILSEEHWNISSFDIDTENNDAFDPYKFLKKFIEGNNLPQYVFLQKMDERLLINLNEEKNLAQIYKQFTQYGKVTLYSAKFRGDMYERELVLTSEKKVKEVSVKKNMGKIQEVSLFDSDRYFVPGEDWMYIKLYGIDNIGNLLKMSLKPFFGMLLEKGIISNYFFVNYFENGKKLLRVRFRVSSENTARLFLKITNWSRESINNSYITGIDYSTYDRELERYGGKNLIEYSEKIFGVDSGFAINHIQQRTDKAFLIFSALAFLFSLGINYEEQRELFFNLYSYKQHRKEYQIVRKQLDFDELRGIYSGKFKEYNQIEKNDILLKSSDKAQILLSLLHLHFNRFCVMGDKELELMIYIRHVLKDLEYQLL